MILVKIFEIDGISVITGKLSIPLVWIISASEKIRSNCCCNVYRQCVGRSVPESLTAAVARDSLATAISVTAQLAGKSEASLGCPY